MAAQAEGNADNNQIQLSGDFEANTLSILQAPASVGNSVTVRVSGTNNGAASIRYQPDPAWFEASAPGIVRQSGRKNSADLEIAGIGNLFGITQRGTQNSVTGRISGTGNQAAISQTGHSNRAVFTQTGTNNFVAIQQSM
ncbi:hypothetical protein KDD17_07490 [Sulfitobacter albidus]|uniref:Curlin n=1 Tax=Sulfitobacter albidus TaxID=2829501 RepID=A0A975JFW1_9RHOB|nr:hypothetical protein [Sulfitobacter albidus]QUJ77776.1 hypothetical protein KDD17_07490 [Sulfitobacter albidus]